MMRHMFNVAVKSITLMAVRYNILFATRIEGNEGVRFAVFCLACGPVAANLLVYTYKGPFVPDISHIRAS